MTVAELIDSVLSAIWHQFDYYAGQPERFARDKQALMKAIARVGYTCEQNGWQLNASECLAVIMTVLREVKTRQADVKYLPVYLDGAIGRHLGQKAEEYSAAQKARGIKRLANVITRTVDGVERVEAVREKSATETLAALYHDLRLRGRRRKKAAPDRQEALL